MTDITVYPVKKENMVLLVTMDHQVRKEHKDHQDNQRLFPERKVNADHLEPTDERVNEVVMDLMVVQERMDQMDQMDQKVVQDAMEILEALDHLVTLAQPDMVIME